MQRNIDELNDKPFRTPNRQGSRRGSFLEEEKAFMKPLPPKPYEPSVWIPNVKVGYDYLVSDGVNKYSVPFDLIGERVDVRIASNTAEIFFHGNRVALHVREKTLKKDPIVNPDHMTLEHRKYLNYNTEDFLIWAGTVGHRTKEVVKYFLNSGKEAEQGFKFCASLTKLADKYGSERLEQTCSKVLTRTSSPSIRIISTVLKSGQEAARRYAGRARLRKQLRYYTGTSVLP